MEPNIGDQDRIARLVIGAVLAVVGIVALAGVVELGMLVGAVALVVGAILLVTGAMRTCPAYLATGISTLRQS